MTGPRIEIRSIDEHGLDRIDVIIPRTAPDAEQPDDDGAEFGAFFLPSFLDGEVSK
jgi:hypothetical protein